MSTPLPRRSVLGAAGVVSLGALFAACTRSSDAPRTEGSTVTTDTGGTATVQPTTAGTASSARAMLDEATSCTLAPETTEGPYYFDVDSIRSDIREDRVGVTMRLALRVQDASEGCAPVASAVVDIWHCDAEGLYSGFESASRGGAGALREPGPAGHRIDTGDMVYDQADAEGTPVLLTLKRDGDEVLAATNIVVA